MTTIMLRSPAAAMAWQLWTRYRSGALQSLAILAVAAALYPRLFALSHAEWLVALSALPLVPVFGTVFTAFTMADDPANPSRGFPRRMFALPVPTHTLVFWPMALGAVMMALTWVATACLVYRPSGFATPVLLPALGLAAGVVWFQAFGWTPLASLSVRVVIMSVLLTSLGMLPALLDGLHLMPGWAVELLVVSYLPAAFLVALVGVRSDRRGDTWHVVPAWLRLGRFFPRPEWRRPFASRFAAQMAYEWRNHGLFLPAASGFIVAAFLVMAPVNWFHPNPGLLRGFLASAVGITLYSAAMSGLNTAEMKPFWVLRSGAAAFVMTRPVTSGALVTSKFRAAWRSTLLAWAVVVLGVGLWVVPAGASQDAVALWQDTLGRLEGWRAAAVVALLSVALPGVAWSLSTLYLAVGLSGRQRLINLAVGAFFASLLAGGAGRLWCELHPEDGPRLLAVVPWLVASAAGLKAAVALWAFPAALGRGLIGRSSLVVAGAVWLGLFACVAALAVLLWPSQGAPVTRPVALLGAAALLPLGRFALAPLALDWKRHG
jgi:hypothetical protein